MAETVTMPAETAMFLVAGHINMLASADEDDVVRPYAAAGGWDWWDADADCVDRALLARAWRQTECHADIEWD